MTGRGVIWAGGLVAVAAVAVLAVYFAVRGLRPVDTVGVVGAVVGIAGLALAVRGLIVERRGARDRAEPSAGGSAAARVQASGERSVAIGGDNSGIISTGDDTTNTGAR
ncbi:hypothetical protein AGRA3207_007769 [Actinomadura graeca]|uniref:Uncharacterized protein n=1 Tax=Actinomadura graeca TaxID=2750812 RepID=A0ABX8R6K9_9ACTN|nr:hypothetical protein [Actinomadura graeca]QXJ26156.1 hypothetical protein AGRA3207_007769 [Actinomadura graeca]